MISGRYPPASVRRPLSVADRVSDVLADFTEWLARYGETSWDHQSFFAGPVGRRAKSLYYWNHLLGTAAVAPIIFFEAFVPSARKRFYHPLRFPIAGGHYAMGVAFLYAIASGSVSLGTAGYFVTLRGDARCSTLNW